MRKTWNIRFLFLLCIWVTCFSQYYERYSPFFLIHIVYSEEDLYRPNFHFTPKKGWMNDPNGMVYYEGEYHLFYQFFPDNTILS